MDFAIIIDGKIPVTPDRNKLSDSGKQLLMSEDFQRKLKGVLDAARARNANNNVFRKLLQRVTGDARSARTDHLAK